MRILIHKHYTMLAINQNFYLFSLYMILDMSNFCETPILDTLVTYGCAIPVQGLK